MDHFQGGTSEFEECMFPKLTPIDQCNELKRTLPRLSKEWSEELVNTKNVTNINETYPQEFALSHWQCEPFYYFLQKNQPTTSLKFFDKSGWSYRVENDINDFRLFEFQRIECVWFCDKTEAELLIDKILCGLALILKKFGLNVSIVQQKDEEVTSSELIVKDIELSLDSNHKIELAGGHLHGRLFIDGLNISSPKHYYTGCCGIGMSRIINALIHFDLL